ncbi:hypothetical protein BDY24DRAFT_396032 [Mrakia frigida]|uniref:BTB/POZ domain-containing protein n=1 Tax=Mrakia frigida TaxID=29902 RepID=UPI003FCC0E42
MSTPSTSTAPTKRTRSSLPIQDSDETDDPSAGPSKKYKKPSNLSSLPPPPRARSARFYFSDGNIILQVQDTDFKVHRGVLESQSSVFKDMFAVGRDAGGGGGEKGKGSEKIMRQRGGLPLWMEGQRVETVELVHDVAGAWEIMLAVLYDGLSFALRDLSLDDIYALLHLSDKYEFTSHLALAQSLLIGEANKRLNPSFDRTDVTEPDLVGALDAASVLRIIDLGKRFDVPAVLPKAFYLLAKLSEDLDTIAEVAKQDESWTGWEVLSLDRDDVMRILRITRYGLEQQRSFEFDFDPWASAFHIPSCGELEHCRDGASTDLFNRWFPLAQRSHVDYRAILLSIINDPSPWGGKPACKELIIKSLETKLKEFDETL